MVEYEDLWEAIKLSVTSSLATGTIRMNMSSVYCIVGWFALHDFWNFTLVHIGKNYWANIKP